MRSASLIRGPREAGAAHGGATAAQVALAWLVRRLKPPRPWTCV